MMTNDLWINLPVKDLKKSKSFFKKIGFSFNENFGGNPDEAACLVIGAKPVIVMLFVQNSFKNFVNHNMSDPEKGSEVLLSFDASSTDEVDELLQKVENAGGTIYNRSENKQSWMYGFGFTDLDGHRWNVLHMDLDKKATSNDY